MSETEEPLVITVQSVKAGEPAIRLFQLTVTGSAGHWPETFGTRELMQACLKGISIMLPYCKLWGELSWDFPETFSEPSGIRWTLERGKPPQRQDLDSSGQVIDRG